MQPVVFEWFVQKDGKVRQFPEGKLRADLRNGKYNGLELIRRADEPQWYPLHDSPMYAQEVAFEGSAQDHARWGVVRGFGWHFLAFVAVNAALGSGFIALCWGIGLVVHGAKAFPSLKGLYYEGKLPGIPAPQQPHALPPSPPPQAPPTTAPQTAPNPVVPALTGQATPQPSASADPFGPTGVVADAGASSSMAYEPTLGVSPTPSPTSRSLPEQQLHASVRGRLFGSENAAPIRIGRYRLDEQLGAGGMGIVYRAHDESLDRTVALKLLRDEIDADAGTERLQREARSMAKVSHPNVVTVFDVGVHERSVFVAMEYVQGRTLGGWLRDAQSVGNILDVLRQAGEGLSAAHGQGLVHRDFKPENVIVGDDGRVKVLDFGLAKPMDDRVTHDALTRTGTVLGTPRYMSPEQFRGEPADIKSDQFAFALVIYEAIYGTHPYQPEDDMPLPRAVLKGRMRPMPPRADVPNSVRDAIQRGVAHDPDDRFASIREMLDAFGPIPNTSDELASIAAAVRRLLARRQGREASEMLVVLDSIEGAVAELDAKSALLASQSGREIADQIDRELQTARAELEDTDDDDDRALLRQQIGALEQRRSGLDRAEEVLARLRTRRSVAETQLEQLHLDLTRAEVGESPLPDLTGPLAELRFQVDAAQEVEALLAQ